MTISGYSNAIVDAMLGWLKGLANWVLRLFNLAGSTGFSPLRWLSDNWLRLLVVLMIVGVAADILVWLVRWRPHWVWFRKLRVIVDDERFFNESDIQEQLNRDDDDLLERNWDERDYVVASTVVGRASRRPRAEEKPVPGRRRSAKAPEKRTGSRAAASVQRGERRRKSRDGEKPEAPRRRPSEKKQRNPRPERRADPFGMNGARPGVTDLYEDEVFNVNNLPKAEEK